MTNVLSPALRTGYRPVEPRQVIGAVDAFAIITSRTLFAAARPSRRSRIRGWARVEVRGLGGEVVSTQSPWPRKKEDVRASRPTCLSLDRRAATECDSQLRRRETGGRARRRATYFAAQKAMRGRGRGRWGTAGLRRVAPWARTG